jgi:tight adherence protein B
MTMWLILALVFASTLWLVVATHGFLNRRRLSDAEALRDRLADSHGAPDAVRILKQERASRLPLLDRLLTGKPITMRLSKALERGASRQTVGAFLLTSVLAGAIGWFIGVRVSATVGLLLAIGAAVTPSVVLRWRQARRISAFEAQLPEAIDMLVNAMKSGYSLQAAMHFVGDEMGDPLGPEFARFYEEQRLGIDVRVALAGLQSRVDSLDLRMFVTSLLIQRETGGNLAEIMTNLATLMRERVGVRGQIETLTAEPRLSAVVLALLPIGLFFVFNVLNRDYMSSLYTTGIGRLLLLYGAISTTVGYLILRKLGKIDI